MYYLLMNIFKLHKFKLENKKFLIKYNSYFPNISYSLIWVYKKLTYNSRILKLTL